MIQLQDSFSLAVNSNDKESSMGSFKMARKIKTSELRRSQRFNNYLKDSSIRSERTADVSERNPAFDASNSSSVGDFSRAMGSSMTMSHSMVDPSSSLA